MKDKIEKHIDIVCSLLEEYAAPFVGNSSYEKQLLIDTKHLHFQLQSVGWDGDTFTHSVMLHFDIKPNGKIWIQQNWTEDDVAVALLQRGVERTDIVVGFQPPRYRELSGYAVT